MVFNAILLAAPGCACGVGDAEAEAVGVFFQKTVEMGGFA